MYEYRNPKFNGYDNSFDCQINHPTFGWIDFTCNAAGTLSERELYNAIAAAGNAAPPAPPSPEEQRAKMPALTMRQFRLQLLEDGLLSQVDAAINAMPSPQKEAAQIEWEYASVVERLNSLIESLKASLDLSDGQIDAMWEKALLK